MIKFSVFRALNESSALINDTSHLKHLSHPEESVFVPGAFNHAIDALTQVHKHLLIGDKAQDFLVSTKLDGAPSIVFGVHPLTGEFFVGTKAVFNKRPKINYTVSDIRANHGHAQGLVRKLEQALKYLPKIMPASGGIYQADVLFDTSDITEDKFGLHFKPNTIQYTVNKSHKDYRSIKRAKFGLAIHTVYIGTPQKKSSLDGMRASFDNGGIKLQSHVDVHQSDINFDSSTVSMYEAHKAVEQLLREATSKYSSFSQTELEALYFHSLLFRTFVNFNIRNSGKTTVEQYRHYAIDKLQKKVDSMKSDTGRERHQAVLDEWLENYKKHKGTLKKALEVHNIVENAKDLIVDAMNTAKQQYDHSVNGVKTAPEGYVATVRGMPVKLVHRHEFSRLNFNNSTF